MKTNIKKLNNNDISDFRELLEVFRDVFELEEALPNNHNLGKVLSNPDFLVFVVKNSQKVIGGLTIYKLANYYSVKPLAYIYDVGVAREFQGQGLGKLLISEVCKYCKENGFEEVFVETESDDIDAVSFYKRTKYTSEMDVQQFTYTL